ncbi:hypothetical protein HPG69_006395 [Diceros bicornis minor]|uniref:Ig-like domain-containing protein n=1 Tax=Diceros bicornis minor TaxID=77932 RepID=A0A7J7EWG7_DICBM|nr:hypothetical protein HPG69_006395 [Diceros bicornis minor]
MPIFRDSRALGSGAAPQSSRSLPCGVNTQDLTDRPRTLGGLVIEGGNLVLLCSVAEGIGNITFFWHREFAETTVGKWIQYFPSAELQIPAVKEHNAGHYYCGADNGHDPIQSNVVNILVRMSCPVLTFRVPGAQAMMGDMVELRCESLPQSCTNFIMRTSTWGTSWLPLEEEHLSTSF